MQNRQESQGGDNKFDSDIRPHRRKPDRKDMYLIQRLEYAVSNFV